MTSYYENYITEQEIQDLWKTCMEYFDKIPKRKNERKYVRFGSFKPYRSGLCIETIPDFLKPLIQKLIQDHIISTVDSITINYYDTGYLIAAHIDSLECGPEIPILSLGGPATMILRDTQNNNQNNNQEIILQSGSLYILKGLYRYDWTHEILPVTSPRISIVFRSKL